MKTKALKLSRAILAPTAPNGGLSFEEISAKTGKSVETLKIFARISDPKNAHVFSADSAYKAFSKLGNKR